MTPPLPADFVERMTRLLGPEGGRFLATLDGEPLAGLRVNTLKVSPDEWARRNGCDLRPVPWCPAGFLLGGDARPGKHPDHAAGLYYLQEPSAMAVAEAVSPRPGELVLDLCAAPGGKSTHLAALADDQALLVANEIEPSRARTLAGNLERLGIRNALVLADQPARLAERWGAAFDRVLVDAPCSGEGMFRKSPATRSEWSPGAVRGCAERQARLVREAAALVRPGGRLVYSTCTFSPEENEGVIDGLLADRPDFRPAHGGPTRIWPHRDPGEGHFLAVLQRDDGTEVGFAGRASWPTPSRKSVPIWRRFVDAELGGEPLAGAIMAEHNGRLFAVPDGFPDPDGLRVVRVGLELGSIRKERFEPAHALALAARSAEPRRLFDLARDDERLAAYLRGHPLREPGEDGWVLIRAGGHGIGWGRRAKGVIKNAYPKGLRWA